MLVRLIWFKDTPRINSVKVPLQPSDWIISLKSVFKMGIKLTLSFGILLVRRNTEVSLERFISRLMVFYWYMI